MSQHIEEALAPRNGEKVTVGARNNSKLPIVQLDEDAQELATLSPDSQGLRLMQ